MRRMEKTRERKKTETKQTNDEVERVSALIASFNLVFLTFVFVFLLVDG